MKYIFILIGLLFAIYPQAHSQEYDNIQGFKIGLTPSALMNKWMGFQGKVSYTHKKIAFEANVGYLAGKNNGEVYSGIRIRPLLKYYFTHTDNEYYYFGFGGLYRKVDLDAEGTFGRFNNSYYQTLDFKLTQKLKGLYFMFGILIPLRGEHFFTDVGLGIGNSRVNIEHFGVPDDAVFYNTTPLFNYDTRSPGTIGYLIFFGHLSFMYKF